MVGIIGLVGKQGIRLKPLDQIMGLGDVIALTGGSDQLEWHPKCIGCCMDPRLRGGRPWCSIRRVSAQDPDNQELWGISPPLFTPRSGSVLIGTNNGGINHQPFQISGFAKVLEDHIKNTSLNPAIERFQRKWAPVSRQELR